MAHQGIIAVPRAKSFFPDLVRQREQSQRLLLGHTENFYKRLYSSFSPCLSRDGEEFHRSENGLLTLEFSPDGSLLVAGCENNSFLMFDPLSRRMIRTVQNTHDSVTHVKFLNSRIFATGGVDQTVSLWDTRNLKSQWRTLAGHSSMIGNIEFSRKNGLLITTGLCGVIYIWDINNWKLRGEFNNNTFMSHVFLRLRLNPDETKMIISTASGYLLIVHNLDLNTIPHDLKKFSEEMFEFAYVHQDVTTSGRNPRNSSSQNRRRNRVEIVSDFPNAGGFNVISALEIHPQGWSAFTRSTSQESGQEWTCVHDIQERELSEVGAALREESEDEGFLCPQQDDATGAIRQRLERINEERCSASAEVGDTDGVTRASVRFYGASGNDSGSELPDAAFALEREARERSVSPTDTAREKGPQPGSSSPPADPLEPAGLRSDPASSWAVDPSPSRPNSSVAQFNRKVNVRFPRLTHFTEEPNFSKWYISSLGVSPDGRLVCSPLENGIRLLGFSPECSEQSVSWCGTKPRRLHELYTHNSGSGSVLCTKFSPRHCLLVCGSCDGKLAWYQPVV